MKSVGLGQELEAPYKQYYDTMILYGACVEPPLKITQIGPFHYFSMSTFHYFLMSTFHYFLMSTFQIMLF